MNLINFKDIRIHIFTCQDEAYVEIRCTSRILFVDNAALDKEKELKI